MGPPARRSRNFRGRLRHLARSLHNGIGGSLGVLCNLQLNTRCVHGELRRLLGNLSTHHEHTGGIQVLGSHRKQGIHEIELCLRLFVLSGKLAWNLHAKHGLAVNLLIKLLELGSMLRVIGRNGGVCSIDGSLRFLLGSRFLIESLLGLVLFRLGLLGRPLRLVKSFLGVVELLLVLVQMVDGVQLSAHIVELSLIGVEGSLRCIKIVACRLLCRLSIGNTLLCLEPEPHQAVPSRRLRCRVQPGRR